MDVLQYMKTDHDTIRSGLDELVTADGVKARRASLEPLSREIQTHLILERDYLYPEVSGLFPGAEALSDVGLANAATIVKRLKVLVKLTAKPVAEQDGWEKRLAELRESVLKHFEHEDASLLPKMRYLIRTEDREDLGQVFVDVRDDILSSLGGVEPAVAPAPAAPAPASTKRKRA